MLEKLLHSWMKSNETIILSNVAEGVHAQGNITYSAASVISSKYLFGKQTTSANQIDLAGSGNTSSGARAIGVITDESEAAGDPVNVTVLGASGRTMKVQAGGTIAIGDLLTADSTSKAVAFSAQATGTYYIYGIALNAATSGGLVEFAPVAGVEKTQ